MVMVLEDSWEASVYLDSSNSVYYLAKCTPTSSGSFGNFFRGIRWYGFLVTGGKSNSIGSNSSESFMNFDLWYLSQLHLFQMGIGLRKRRRGWGIYVV